MLIGIQTVGANGIVCFLAFALPLSLSRSLSPCRKKILNPGFANNLYNGWIFHLICREFNRFTEPFWLHCDWFGKSDD